MHSIGGETVEVPGTGGGIQTGCAAMTEVRGAAGQRRYSESGRRVMSRVKVALVGRRLAHNENLGLCYLRGALRHADIEVEVHYVNDGEELLAAHRAITEQQPDVVGLSLSDGGSALWPLALGELLAKEGFAGHITSGGQFATLARRWLLERYPWLDTVVRFAGEAALVELCQNIERGSPVGEVAGVTTRDGDGLPAQVLEVNPKQVWPERDELSELLGHTAVHMSGSRGCWGRCQYCGPAALHTLERKDGRQLGTTVSELNRAGVGGLRRRDLGDVCHEMAQLWHERGARYFYFVDEHLLPYDEEEALVFLDRFGSELARRKVGALGIGAMLRADRVTPKVLEEFSRVGLVRCYVGLELATREEGRRFCRPAPTERELELLAVFADLGVATVSNLMLVHPYSTLESIGQGIDLLERIPAGVFETTRMMVYQGTRLQERMAAENRLIGNPLRYGYTFDDERVEGFAEIFSRLRGEAFWNYSVAYRAHDVYLALALARRLYPDRLRQEGALEPTRQGINRLYVEAYRRGLELAEQGGRFADASSLVSEIRERAGGLERRLDEVERRVLTDIRAPERRFAPIRSAAAAAFTFVLATGCGGSTDQDSGSGPKDASADGSGGTSGTGGGGGTGGGTGGASCTDTDIEAAKATVKALVKNTDPCFSGGVTFSTPGGSPQVRYDLMGFTGGLMVRVCDTPASKQVTAKHEQNVSQALAGNVPQCIYAAGQFDKYVPIEGNATDEAKGLGQAIDKACGGQIGFPVQLKIVLDVGGKVVDVVTTPNTPAINQCVTAALAGLSFPCLASLEVCPEYAIAE